MDDEQKQELQDLMREEMNRGRRRIDIETRRQRARLLKTLRSLLAKPEDEFANLMRDAGLKDGSPEMETALRIWREFRT